MPPSDYELYRQRLEEEYTVVVGPKETVGNRGAKRLVVGSNGKVYYTGDHYRSFSDTGYRIR